MSTSPAFLSHVNKLHTSFSDKKRKNQALDNCIMKITSQNFASPNLLQAYDDKE